jgi:hypothetical protein
LIPKTAPLGAKVVSLGLGAAAGPQSGGKRLAQSAADAAKNNPGSGSSSSNTATNTANTNNLPVNSKAPTNTGSKSNNLSVNSDTPTNTANNNINFDNLELDGASPPLSIDLSLDQYIILSPNGAKRANSIISMAASRQ